jgi:enamine deaminase RidA (YjgF/YER057c/UK114 family)
MLVPVNPPNSPPASISQGIILQGKGIFVTSGHCALDQNGEPLEGDFAAQVAAVFESLGRTLKAAGLSFENVARITTYVTDFEPSMTDTIRAVRSKYISKDRPPTSVLIAAAALYDPRLRIEVEVLAVVP